MNTRAATQADAGAVVATMAGAFHDDPVWSWAFPDEKKRADQLAAWLGLFFESALPNGWVWLTGEQAAAASIWTPPGESELSEDAKARVEPFLRDAVGAHAPSVLELMELFEEACPSDTDFFYLSFLGTNPNHRGKGLGVALLGENLDRIDADGKPAYLESSNPANNARYERLGFRRHGELETPDGAHTVTTMWREAR